jgi:threonylcarbamoyladenosine tRNA methylthiotransferase MtaB
LIEAIRKFEADRSQNAEKIDINHTKEYESLFLARSEEHTRAHLKVQDGCNQFCSYCIIPYARGRVRSREIDDVRKEARQLAQSGCQEVVLTGIHLSSYGVDHGSTLLELIQAVHEIPGISRIRLGSLEPGIITQEFAEALAALPKLCPHFHLSLQSGCTTVLKRMNRRYTAEEFEEKCRILREVFDRPAITTDVIVGFPGESDEEFETTVAFLERIHLYETHIFKYSRRHGTKAAVMPDQIPETVKGTRSERLIALGEKNRSLFEAQHAGGEVTVLFEERTELDGAEYFTGYTKEYIKAAIPADEDYENVQVHGRLGKELAPHLFLLEK